MGIKFADRASWFKPWVGKTWNHPGNIFNGAKVLVLSESHYGWEPGHIGQSSPDWTKYCVKHWGIDTKSVHFTKVLQTITGRPRWQMTQTDIRSFWESVVYYNYVPVFVGDTRLSRPTKEMYQLGAEPFHELVAQLNPETILAFGYDMWKWILTGWFGVQGSYWKDHSDIGQAQAIKLKHPSARGFSWRNEHQKLIDNQINLKIAT